MTSGTTGQPKAVEHRHSNVGICAQYYERVLSCTRMDRLFATSRFHFAYAIGNMFAALRIGASNILLERWATTPSVAETVERFKPTLYNWKAKYDARSPGPEPMSRTRSPSLSSRALNTRPRCVTTSGVR
jgi:acyl-coenzyme A synthetase/AMP-(fatty) acid ligase